MKNMMLLMDFYKVCHRLMYPGNMTKLYSTWTPRSNQYSPEADKVVWFGLQGFLKKLIKDFNEYFFSRDIEEVVEEYEMIIHNTFDEMADSTHILELHALGYLPLKICSLPEGTRVPFRVPCATVENTDKRFAWLTNYLETLWSCSMWLPTTTATTAYTYRKIIKKYTELTSDNLIWNHVGCGDFSYRGMGSPEAAITSGAAFLTSFTKTSTIPSIQYLCEYYNADIENEDIGSWSASVEHSCTTSNFAIDGNEEEFFLRMCNEICKDKPFSFVADSYDYFNFLNDILRRNKDSVINHKGSIRIRPDSGDPEKIICGSLKYEDLTNENYIESLEDAKEAMKDIILERVREETPHGEYGEESPSEYFKYNDKFYKMTLDIFWNRYDKQYYYIDGVNISSCEEVEELSLEQKGSLWILDEIFGHTINSKGYKVLNGNIGIVYGDAITLERCESICSHMKEQGWAIENVVFGVGSFSLQYKTRDSQGWAYKATYGEIDGKPIMIYKDPKTDRESGHAMKKSQKGRVSVYKNEDGELDFKDGLYPGMVTTCDIKPWDLNLLQPIFVDGKMIKEENLNDIRQRLHGGKF